MYETSLCNRRPNRTLQVCGRWAGVDASSTWWLQALRVSRPSDDGSAAPMAAECLLVDSPTLTHLKRAAGQAIECVAEVEAVLQERRRQAQDDPAGRPPIRSDACPSKSYLGLDFDVGLRTVARPARAFAVSRSGSWYASRSQSVMGASTSSRCVIFRMFAILVFDRGSARRTCGAFTARPRNIHTSRKLRRGRTKQ